MELRQRTLKAHVGLDNMRPQNFFVCGPKFTKFLSPNVEGVVVDEIFFRCLICWSVTEIFAIKVESCQKSRRNLEVFLALPNFRGRAFQKWYLYYHPSLVARGLEKCREGTPTSRELIGAHTLNLRPNFKFSRLNIFWTGIPIPASVCAM